MRGIYVHFPFCRKRCIYCDFFTVGDRLADWSRYASAVLAEARQRIPAQDSGEPRTLYFGGGTPSLMPPAQFHTLAAGLRELTGNVEEFTMEVNPDDVTEELADVWLEAGVDRISMGVQTFDDILLRTIGRRHDAASAEKAYGILRKRFRNISLDLMFGLPGQTLASLRESVERLVGLAPEHVSVYSLMYEERTAITALRDSGRVKEVPEEDSASMFEHISEQLAKAGYEQYEISNYARPGYRSRHNSLYWRGEPYIGLGPGAHSYDGARLRTANLADLKRYQEFWNERIGENPIDEEHLDDDQLREEMIMTRLRTREGLSLAEFEARFGPHALASLLTAARPSLAAGTTAIIPTDTASNAREGVEAPLLTFPSAHLALTRSGIMVSDDIISCLF